MTGSRRQPTTWRDDGASELMHRMQREERRARERRRQLGTVVAVFAGVALIVGAALAVGRRPRPLPPAVAPVVAQAIEATATPAQAPPASPPTRQPTAEKTRATRPTVKRAPAPTPAPAPTRAPAAAPATQRISIRIGPSGYEPSTIHASSKSPIVLRVGQGEGCAAGFLMPRLGISKDNSAGAVTVRLGRLGRGTYMFTCAMSMVSGQLIVR